MSNYTTKVLSETTSKELEVSINNCLDATPYQLYKIKFSTMCGSSHFKYSALLVFIK